MLNRKHFLLCIILIFFSGCITLNKKTSGLSESGKIHGSQFPEYAPSVVEDGSLWSPVGGVTLYYDNRARKIGDIVTVRIVEDPEATLNANTKTSRSSSIDASSLMVLGYMKELAAANPNLAQNPGTDDLMLAKLGLKFDGKGTSDRDGHVKAYVSAVVLKTFPNGNLYINGKREIKVNRETQYITLSGIIRPEDISSSNEISSAYVANARITYAGIGPIADKQKPGWLGRLVDHVWPF